MAIWLKQTMKSIVYSSRILYYVYGVVTKLMSKYPTKTKIENHGFAMMKKDITGIGHFIKIGYNTTLQNISVRMRGSNNRLIFGDDCSIGAECSFWLEGSNLEIIIGNRTSMTWKVHVNAQEYNNSIIIGEDCMFSNNIIIRTSDGHPIYDKNIRTNIAKSVIIGDHVWIAPNSKVMKGSHIGEGCIIGSDSMVTKDIPAYSLAVGHPAKVVKSNVKWTREVLF